MSRRERLAVFGFPLFVAVGLVPQPAAAVSFLRVSYSVTGGIFNGPNLSGPITGGAVSYITNPGITVIPSGYWCSGACGELTRVTLAGPAGNFTLIDSVPFSFLANISLYGGAMPQLARAYAHQSFRSGGGTAQVDLALALIYDGAAARFHANPPGLDHFVTLGAEVRSVVPEPATATLLGLGLLGLAIGGSSTAGARRLHRR